jgi:hypothetical protein
MLDRSAADLLNTNASLSQLSLLPDPQLGEAFFDPSPASD